LLIAFNIAVERADGSSKSGGLGMASSIVCKKEKAKLKYKVIK
jgi:hypothetical protein